ncbi:MAG: alpha/beta hydrolase [Micavibrio sp.]|nr:alpha/beta hydrolase [Micavibrio sp.]
MKYLCALMLLLAFATPAHADVTVSVSSIIHYGKDAKQVVQVYQPDICKNASCPVTLWVHGGGWKHGDATQGTATNMLTKWAQQGIVMVGVNYRLAPQVVHPAEAQDIAGAINWVYHNINQYGGDAQRISLLGHSAGAHLVALVGTNPAYLGAYNLSPGKNLANVFPIDTASFDLTKPSAFVQPMIENAFGTDKAVLKEASPIWNVHAGGSYPPFIMAATKVRSDAVSTSRLLKKELRDAGGSADLLIVDYPGASQLKAHGNIAKDLANLNCTLTKTLLARVLTGQ